MHDRSFFSQFTTRQHEVLVCVLAGDSNAEIASFLGLSESSVKRYVAQLMKVAGAGGRDEVRAQWAAVALGKAA
jgi:DNA-binding NarL/FixJ family response regulator